MWVFGRIAFFIEGIISVKVLGLFYMLEEAWLE